MPINEEMAHYWLIVILSLLPVLIWVRPRIRLLVLKDKKGNLPFLYNFIAIIALAAPTVIAQDYLVTATGRLTPLLNINEVSAGPLTKYYKLKNHFVDKQHVAIYKRSETSGRNNEYLGLYIDVVCPLLSDSTSVGNVATPKAWLGFEFGKHIDNRVSDEEKQTAFLELDTEANNEFKKKDFDEFIYLDRIGVNARHKAYLKAINLKVGEVEKPIVFEAVNTAFEARNGQGLEWVFGSFGIGAAVWFLMIVIPKINNKELKKYGEGTLIADWYNFYGSLSKIRLSGQSNLQITFIIIGLNILVFIIMAFAGLGFVSFEGRDLLAWGADFRPKVINGEWWRLLTSVFLHGGLMHLLGNMYGLFFAGIFLEPLLGRVKFASAYMICGIVSSAASIWWHPATVSIGASGAIFGLYGVLTALLTTKNVDIKDRKGILLFSSLFIIINLLLGLTGGIDNAAHVGGLLCGLLIGYFFYFFADLPKAKEIVSSE
ncbi:MAG TPA: rhomboid family intramembrane serine protease [Mucilaginibacter sp.]|jgi:membrane associated rhomboid family serine protease